MFQRHFLPPSGYKMKAAGSYIMIPLCQTTRHHLHKIIIFMNISSRLQSQWVPRRGCAEATNAVSFFIIIWNGILSLLPVKILYIIFNF
jgi:hypothetical protein